MNRILCLSAFIATAMFFTSCNKDCICRYYNDNDAVINTEVYDADEISNAECADMDGGTDVATEVGDDMQVASHVSCSASW